KSLDQSSALQIIVPEKSIGNDRQATRLCRVLRATFSVYNYLTMHCPFCAKKDCRVLESRLTGENAVRRRRECETCGKRFTTYERVEQTQMLVVKRSGSRDPFSREKLRGGVSRACAKTSVSAEQIDEIVDSVENELSANG